MAYTCQMEVVPDQRATILQPLIQQWMLPATHIISDGWATHHIDQLNSDVYLHDVKNRTSSIPSTQAFIHRMWEICGCGSNANCDTNLAQLNENLCGTNTAKDMTSICPHYSCASGTNTCNFHTSALGSFSGNVS